MMWTGQVLGATVLVIGMMTAVHAQSVPEPAPDPAPTGSAAGVVEGVAAAPAEVEPDAPAPDVGGLEAPATGSAAGAVEEVVAAPAEVEPDVPAPDAGIEASATGSAAGAVEEVVAAPAEVEPAVPEATGVARAVFASGVTEREPIDRLETVPVELETLVFFTAVEGLQGQRVEHRWAPAGERPGFVIGFDVAGPTWRVWSERPIVPDDAGPWQVDIVADGQLLERHAIGR